MVLQLLVVMVRIKCIQIWKFNLSQEKEYKDALEAYNEKNKEKVQLVGRLMEVSNLVNESETLRIKKLDELSKSIESTR